MNNYERLSVDLKSYVQRTRKGPCFICELVAGNPDFKHHVVYEDNSAIAFLDKFPTIAGHVLVAPKQHFEHVIIDFSIEKYLDFQKLIYRIGNAMHHAINTERMYIYTLGSKDGNSHVHWHLAPLPPGVPYEKQQFEALMMENGVLNISDEEMAALALKIRQEII